ncbi:hypothetical protein Pmani_005399 [Petrolisthes manimaculis]|uniref:Uncharacterized protein n=1 Tax=Petrolisthes manimaculis TaxID=1843537 RepID=A0AAE1QBR6_9EUCA|nr:hypothetical protein Pmani_005399 [Petrolisthes manimaculis]
MLSDDGDVSEDGIEEEIEEEICDSPTDEDSPRYPGAKLSFANPSSPKVTFLEQLASSDPASIPTLPESNDQARLGITERAEGEAVHHEIGSSFLQAEQSGIKDAICVPDRKGQESSPSPVLSEKSGGSSGKSQGDVARDRSMSEVYVSVPKVSVLPFHSTQQVSRIVQQFSVQSEDGASNESCQEEGVARRLSLPSWFPPSNSSPTKRVPFSSLQLQAANNPPPLEEIHMPNRKSVSGMVDFFSTSADGFEFPPGKKARESPRKLSKFSPEFKASLEKVGTSLSRGSSIDSHFNTDDGNIIKSFEKVEGQDLSRRGGRLPRRAQKENSPRHRAKPVHRIKEEKESSAGRTNDGCESSWSSSLCHSSVSTTSNKSNKSASQNVISNRVVAGQSSGVKIGSDIIKLAFEGMCDTEEEVEDMPEEREYSGGSEAREGCRVLEGIDVSEINQVSERSKCSTISSGSEISERIEISEGYEMEEHGDSESNETSGNYERTEESMNSDISNSSRKRIVSEGSESSRVKSDGSEVSATISSRRKSDGSVRSATNSSRFKSEESTASSSKAKSERNSRVRSEGSDRSSGVRSECTGSERSSRIRSESSEVSEKNSRLRSEGNERNTTSRKGNKGSNKVNHKNIKTKHSWEDTVSSCQHQQSISLVSDEVEKSEVSVPESSALGSQKLIPESHKEYVKHNEIQVDSDGHCSIPIKLCSDMDLTQKCAEIAANELVRFSMESTRGSSFDQSSGAHDKNSGNNQQESSAVHQLSKEDSISSHFKSADIMPNNVSQHTEVSSCEDLLSMSIEELMGNDGYSSDNSEIILGLVNTSPISAITERTEESTQDNEQLASALQSNREEANHDDNGESESSVSVDQNDDVDTGNTGFVGGSCLSLPLHVASEEAIQSPVLGGSLVQTCVSLEVPNEKPSSQSKPKMKQKMPLLAGGVKSIGRTTTPPQSPISKNFPSGLRASLQRHTSRSLHNLASHPRTALRGHGLSVSSDDLQAGGERIYHLPPRCHQRAKGRYSQGPDTLTDSRLSRRCVSAVALNERGVGRGVGRCLRSSSLGGLNRSRSSSLTSMTSSRRPDYSHVGSKVKQYIKDMKERDLKNTTRSLPTTPPSRPGYGRSSPHVMILNEPLLKDLSQYTLNDTPEDLKKLRKKLVGEKADPRILEEILELLVLERKSRCASDRTLAALQLRYDNMTAMFAEKQNEIDRLRFYKDVKVNEEFTVTLKTKEEEMGRSRRSSVGGTSVVSPRHTPSSSALVTPSHSPSRSSTPCNLIRATSTPIADPNITLALENNNSLISPLHSVNHSTHDASQSDLDITLPDTHMMTCPDPNLTHCSTDLMLPGSDMTQPSTELIQPVTDLTQPDPGFIQQGRDQFQSNVDLTRPYPDVEICQSRSTTRDERMDLGRTVDSGVADSMPEDTTLDSWMKDAEVILKRVKEFAVLEENKVLDQKERTIIWHSILQQYWSLCCQFPVLSSHWPAPQSGLVLQELGQAIQVLATRYNLDLLPQGQSEVTLPITSGPSEKKTGGHVSNETHKTSNTITGKEKKTYSHNDGNSNIVDTRYASNSSTSHRVPDQASADSRSVVDCGTKRRSRCSPSNKDADRVGIEEGHTVKDVGAGCNHRDNSSGQNTGIVMDNTYPDHFKGDSKRQSDGLIETLPLSNKASKSVQKPRNRKEDTENTKVPGKSSVAAGNIISEDLAAKESRMMEKKSTNDNRKNVSPTRKKVADDLSLGKNRASESNTKLLDEITKKPEPIGEGEEGKQKGKQNTVEATFSPAHSRESMKTVGPLEKVKLWQESLIEPDLPPPVSPSCTMSPVSSILSLNSTQPFDLSAESLTTPQPLSPSHQLPQQGASHTSHTMLGHTDTPEDLPEACPLQINSPSGSSGRGNDLLVKPLPVDSSPKVSSTCRSAVSSQVRPESELPKSSWRSSTGTPRPSQCRVVKGRDVDSGCPGSEPSTRLSHNPSLDQPEWGHGNLATSEGYQVEQGLSVLSKSDILVNEVASSLHRDGSGTALSTHNATAATHISSVLCNSQNKSSITRSDTLASTIIRDSEVNDASPSSDLVTMAFPESEAKVPRKLNENSGKNLKQSRASSGGHASSGNRLDLSIELQMGKHRHKDPKVCDLPHGYYSETSGDMDGNGDTASSYDNSVNRSISNHGIKLEMLQSRAKEGSNKNHPKTAAISRGHKNILIDTPAKKQNKDPHRERYVSGNVSNNSTLSQNTSADIYNNISRLKRDLNYIKSQMMNLSSTGLHDRRATDHPRKNSQSPSSKSKRRQGPMKALDTSLLSEYDYDSSSSCTPPFIMKQVPSSSQRSPNISRPRSTRSFDFEGEECRSSVAKSFHSGKKGDNYYRLSSDEFLTSNNKTENLPANTPKRRQSRSREQLEERGHTLSPSSGCKRKESGKHSRGKSDSQSEERKWITDMEETGRKELCKHRRERVRGKLNTESERSTRWEGDVEEKMRRERGWRERNKWGEGSVHITSDRRSGQDSRYSSESEDEMHSEQRRGKKLEYIGAFREKSKTNRKQGHEYQSEDRVRFSAISPRYSPEREMNSRASLKQAWTQTKIDNSTPRVPKLWDTNQETETCGPDVKDQGSQARPLQYTRPLSSSSPLIYIQNYNCTGEVCGVEGGSSNSRRFWSPQHRRSGSSTGEHTHRKRASSYELLDSSICKATALAEKLRLNSNRLLAHLTVHLQMPSSTVSTPAPVIAIHTPAVATHNKPATTHTTPPVTHTPSPVTHTSSPVTHTPTPLDPFTTTYLTEIKSPPPPISTLSPHASSPVPPSSLTPLPLPSCVTSPVPSHPPQT